jgi:hypothetical protein
MQRTLLAALSTLAVLGMALPAMAQDPAALYTRVASWHIAREHWDTYEAFNRQTQKPVLDKLLADGVIVEYGFDTTTVHTEKGGTHSNWFSARTLANLERALAALVSADLKLSTEERKKSDTIFSGENHRDLIMRSLEYRLTSASLSGGYDVTSSVRVKPGKGAQYRELWQKYARPVYEQLLREGAVVAFGMDAEFIHTDDPGTRITWYVVRDADSLDKVETAFESARARLSKEEAEARMRAFSEVLVEGVHRDGMYRILSYAAKEVLPSSETQTSGSGGND